MNKYGRVILDFPIHGDFEEICNGFIENAQTIANLKTNGELLATFYPIDEEEFGQ